MRDRIILSSRAARHVRCTEPSHPNNLTINESKKFQTKFPAWLKKVEALSAQIQACNLDLQSWKQKAKDADEKARYYREKTSDLQEEFKRMSAQLSAMQDFKKYMTPERREAFMKLLHDAARLGCTR